MRIRSQRSRWTLRITYSNAFGVTLSTGTVQFMDCEQALTLAGGGGVADQWHHGPVGAACRSEQLVQFSFVNGSLEGFPYSATIGKESVPKIIIINNTTLIF